MLGKQVVCTVEHEHSEAHKVRQFSGSSITFTAHNVADIVQSINENETCSIEPDIVITLVLEQTGEFNTIK